MTRNTGFCFLLLAVMTCINCQSHITGMQQSMARADEAVVISTLRAITVAQRAYSLSNGGNYGTFDQLVEGNYLDARFKSDKPMVKDYVVSMTVTPPKAGEAEGFYSCVADPQRSGDRAGRHFYIDSTSTEIHVNATQPATATDEVVR